MSISTEGWLVLLALGFYFFDSAVLLEANQALLVSGRRGTWAVRFGSCRVRLAGKEPYLPNPLLPGRVQRRASWRFEGSSVEQPAPVDMDVSRAITRMAPFSCVALVCIFVLLPMALFVVRDFWFTVSVLLMMYLNAMLAMLALYVNRRVIGIAGRAFLALAFECIACPPFTINLVRKLSMRLPVIENVDVAALTLCRPDALPEMRRQLLIRIEEQIDTASEGTDRMELLQARAATLRLGEVQ